MPGGRSAIVVPIRLPTGLRAVMVRESASARLGVPAHVTLLFPFVAARAIGTDVLALVERVLGGAAAFDVAFRDVGRFEPGGTAPNGVVWLAPDPVAPFMSLIDQLSNAFPDYPPYGGVFDEVIPHVTLADDDATRMDSNVAEASRYLPFRRRVSDAALLVEGADGRWRTRRRFPVGGVR